MSWSWVQPTGPDIVDPALLRAGRFDRLVYIGEPTFDDRKKIIGIHTRFMPLEGSSLEEIVGLTAQYNEDAISELVEKLGKDKTVTADEIKAAITPAPETMTGLPSGSRRKRLIEHMVEKNLTFTDPARVSLADNPCRSDRGFCRFGSRIPLPGSRDACPPRGYIRSLDAPL